MDTVAEALAWQIGVWNQMAPVYIREIDKRFVPVVVSGGGKILH